LLLMMKMKKLQKYIDIEDYSGTFEQNLNEGES